MQVADMELTPHERDVVIWLRNHIDIGDSIDRVADRALGAAVPWPLEAEWRDIGELIRLLKRRGCQKASVTAMVTERPNAEASGDVEGVYHDAPPRHP